MKMKMLERLFVETRSLLKEEMEKLQEDGPVSSLRKLINAMKEVRANNSDCCLPLRFCYVSLRKLCLQLTLNFRKLNKKKPVLTFICLFLPTATILGTAIVIEQRDA